MNRAAWLEWRRGGLGGSDVAGVLGLSPWSTPFSVWWSKVRSLEDDDDAVRRRGRLLEPAVLQWAKEELESDTLVKGRPIVHDQLTWARATPDGWTGIDEGLEGKTVQFFDDDWGPSWTDQVPLHVRIQVVWYLAISGARVWRVAALSMIQSEFRIFEVYPDEELADRLLEVAGKWWADHVVADVAPELDTGAATRSYLLERYADPLDQVLEVTDQTDLELLAAYSLAKANQKTLDGWVDELALRVKTRIGGYSGIKDSQSGVRATWSRFDRGRLDLKRLRKERPDLVEVLDQYTRTKPSDRLKLTRRSK